MANIWVWKSRQGIGLRNELEVPRQDVIADDKGGGIGVLHDQGQVEAPQFIAEHQRGPDTRAGSLRFETWDSCQDESRPVAGQWIDAEAPPGLPLDHRGRQVFDRQSGDVAGDISICP